MPARIRGIGLGLAVLAAAPVVTAALSTGPTAVATSAPARPVLAGFQRTVHEIALRPSAVLRLHAPFVTPAPAPAPAPAPHQVAPLRTPHRPAVAVPAQSYPHNAVVADILAAAARYGVDGNWMVRIAQCESGLRPTAINRSGPYYGLFQFLMSTFTHNGGHNIWDPVDQANVAAKMLAHGQAHQWSCA